MSGVRIVSGNAHQKRSYRPSERKNVRVVEGRVFCPLNPGPHLVMRDGRGGLFLLVPIGSYLVLRYPLYREVRA